jgi:hypothetical protein
LLKVGGAGRVMGWCGEGYEEAEHFGLAGCAGFVEHGFDLLADGADGDVTEHGDFFGSVTHEEAVGDFGFGGSEIVEGVEDVVGEMEGFFGVGDEEEEVGVGFEAIVERDGRGEELEGRLAGGAWEGEGAIDFESLLDVRDE